MVDRIIFYNDKTQNILRQKMLIQILKLAISFFILCLFGCSKQDDMPFPKTPPLKSPSSVCAAKTNRALPLQSDKSPITNVLPENNIQIIGSVHYESGKAATGVFVWAECFPHENMRRMYLESYDGDGNRVKSSITRTDEKGNFVVNFPSNNLDFLIKAVAENYMPVTDGPWSCANPPANPLDLIIKDTGGRIAGTFSTADGTPLTNVTAKYLVWEDRSGYECKLSLEIDPDGSFISKPLAVGQQEINFHSFGHNEQRKIVTIAKETLTSLDIIFNPIPFNIITGIVVDATYTTPVENVQVTLGSYYMGKTNSPVTDENGHFWIKTDQYYANIKLSHPYYAPFTQLIYFNKTPQPILYMSCAATVITRIYDYNGLEVTNCEAYLASVSESNKTLRSVHIFGKKEENKTIITNIPTHLSPYRVVVYRPPATEWNALSLSKMFKLEEGETREFDVFLKPPAWLELNFLQKVNTEDVNIHVSRITNGEGSRFSSFANNSFEVTDKKWWAKLFPGEVTGKKWRAELFPGNFQVTVDYLDDRVLGTNIVLTSLETFYLPVIIFNAYWNGVIKGEVYDMRGNPLECHAYAWQTGITDENPYKSYNPKTASERVLENEKRWKQTKRYQSCIDFSHKFRIEKLNTDDRYDLSVSVRGAHTNFFIKAIAPNGPPIKLIAPNMYRVTGRIIDENGKPLQVETWDQIREFESVGELIFSPLPAGTHKLSIMPKDHVQIIKKVTITDDDVDLGEIIAKKGITISGRVVDQSGQPVSMCYIQFLSKTGAIWSYGVTEENGKFVQRGSSPNEYIELEISNYANDYSKKFRKTIGPFNHEKVDIGDIEVNVNE